LELLKDVIKGITTTTLIKCLCKDMLRREEKEATSLFASVKMLPNVLCKLYMNNFCIH